MRKNGPKDCGADATVATLSIETTTTTELAPRSPVTSLRWFGRGDPPLLLSAGRRSFTIGSGGCDLVVPRAASTQVAALHATLTREGTGLRVIDHDSVHGTYRALRGPRVVAMQVEAGDVFWLGDVALLAMDDGLEELRGQVAWCVGLDRHVAIDEAIETIAEGRPLVLHGPRGTDAARLARAIHGVGPQRRGRFVAATAAELPQVERGESATVFLDLEQVRRLPAYYAARLFERGQATRTIIATAELRRARQMLDSYCEHARVIGLTPLARRGDEVMRLLAIYWRDELRSGARVEALGAGAHALADHAWPRGFDELREQARRLLAYVEHGSLRAAADALGIRRQTLAGHFLRIGYTTPTADERDELAWQARGNPIPARDRSGCREPGATWGGAWATYVGRSAPETSLAERRPGENRDEADAALAAATRLFFRRSVHDAGLRNPAMSGAIARGRLWW